MAELYATRTGADLGPLPWCEAFGFFKPSGIVCYSAGGYGGVRAAMQLRAMLAELGMSSVPSLLPFPKAQDTLDEAGVPTADRPGKAADQFFAELEWYGNALKLALEEMGVSA